MTTHYTLDGKKISLLGYGAMRLPTTDGKHAVPWLKEGYSDKAIDQELPDRPGKTLLDGGVPFCFSWDLFYLFLLLMSNIHN